MITTPQPILEAVSTELGESATDTSTDRLRFFTTAVRHYLSLYRWSFKIKEYNLTATSSKEYDLTSLISDYDVSHGVYGVKHGTKILDQVSYEAGVAVPSDTTVQKYFIYPSGKKIGFTAITSGDTYTIRYYATLTTPSSYSDTLNVYIPENHVRAIVVYIKHLIYDRKRQRYDARNAILDFQELLEENVAKEGVNRGNKNVPRTFNPVQTMVGIERNYD